ncbi:MAG: hypothetical protein HYX43_11820 [Burkholderiales bacterium]|nr:hypothetical protein [Burkholderiales bacterium]
MTTLSVPALRVVALCAASLFLTSTGFAQSADATPVAPTAAEKKVDRAPREEGNWYASWGYSRQFYAPSDIRVSQPGLGNDFTVQQVAGSDFPSSAADSLRSLFQLDFTNPQENLRVGKFMNPEKTFAIQFLLDHSKYNSNINQTVTASGAIANQPVNDTMVLDPQTFSYALHSGLNHVMVNAVWLHHLAGPEQQAGDLQLISRAGAGVLLPQCREHHPGTDGRGWPQER